MMKTRVVLAFMVLLALVLSACGASPSPETPVVVVEPPKFEPSAEITCWGFDASGNGFKEWIFTPAIEGTWEEMPVCESGAISIAWSDSLVETDDNWVWSGVIPELEKGEQLGTIICDGADKQALYAYEVYDCMSYSASYDGVKISSDPLVIVPSHP